MITFVSFLWNTGFRQYKPEHINLLAHALHYWCKFPHRFVCITDDKEGFSPLVEVYKTPAKAKKLRAIDAPQGKQFPSCYSRLWLLSDEAREVGDTVMQLDVDCFILKDLSPLFDYEPDADFVGWRPRSIWGREGRIGGGTWRHKTGTLNSLWEQFIDNPQRMILETREKGWNGSDQAILSRFLAHKYPIWPQMCGIYGMQDGVFEWNMPPKDSLIVHFNSEDKPWNQSKTWMRAYVNAFKNYPAAAFCAGAPDTNHSLDCRKAS